MVRVGVSPPDGIPELDGVPEPGGVPKPGSPVSGTTDPTGSP